MDQKPNQPNRRITFLKTINIAIEFGFIIVLPLLAFGYAGKWLDHRYQQNFFILVGVLLALIISGLWFYKRINEILKDLKNL